MLVRSGYCLMSSLHAMLMLFKPGNSPPYLLLSVVEANHDGIWNAVSQNHLFNEPGNF